MSDQDLLTPELAERLEKLLDELRATPCTGQEAARMALAAGVGIVEAKRRAFLVDVDVHAGVLARTEYWRKLALAHEPVPMILFCPRCGARHVDQADPASGWLNEPHRSHLCASCGNIWRPADIATVGVPAIATRGRLDVEQPLAINPVGAHSSHDKHGRAYAKLADLRAGDIIELDGGFTCHAAGEVEVQVDEDGPYFACSDGRHYLDGQADDGRHCVGVYLARKPASEAA